MIIWKIKKDLKKIKIKNSPQAASCTNQGNRGWWGWVGSQKSQATYPQVIHRKDI
tara:strand:- start:300 stop:464 length:165 start_codon:yes stop_codon:yes gene_type:complete